MMMSQQGLGIKDCNFVEVMWMMMQFVDHHGFLTPIELFLEPFGVALCLHLETSVFRP